MLIPQVRLRLAKRLRQLRKRYGYSQEHLAERAGIDAKYYQKIEGKKPKAVKIDTLDKIAKALGVPTWKLLQPKN